MESVAYILILTLAIGVLFFAIAFREPPRFEKKEEKNN
ncbi:photosystem II reaction center protein T [Anabaena sp. UHCC 0187]|nr:photosystem II reaction center protein T [Anabaena sp. UHCC 0187]MTJ14453.1 photosystem II reaction center protein T [Anabaena sp. UHCC 0187]